MCGDLHGAAAGAFHRSCMTGEASTMDSYDWTRRESPHLRRAASQGSCESSVERMSTMCLSGETLLSCHVNPLPEDNNMERKRQHRHVAVSVGAG